MGFSIAAGLAGFAKRGMQFNNEQRQLTNENIKAAVNLTATDALAQRAARQKIKTDYRNTATSMKSMGMSDVQIEAAYGELGDDAYTKIKANLDDHVKAWTLKNQKQGIEREWTKDDTVGWLAKQFTGTEGLTGRSIEAQAQARADTIAPMTTTDFGALARSIVAGSGEITMRSSDRRAEQIRNQMEASFAAASGGIQETGEGATFNAQGARLTLQPTSAELRAMERDIAETSTVQSGATTAGVEADYAESMADAKLDALELDNVLKAMSVSQLEKMNPLLVQQLQGRIQGQNLDNIFNQATQGDRIAMRQLEVALGEIKTEAGLLGNTLTKMKIRQEPQLFALQLEQLGLSIAGMKSDNIVKAVQAQNEPVMAELALELRLIEAEQGALRTTLLGEQITAAQDKNALAGVESDILNERLALLKEQVRAARQPSTFQAAFLEIDQAIDELDPSDSEYDAVKARLEAQKTQVAASLAAYTDASTADTSTDPKFPSLVNGYNKSLKGKLETAGFVINKQLQITDDGISWIGKKSGPAFQSYMAIREKHDSQYYAAVVGYDHGADAIRALGITAPGMPPMTERMVLDPSGGPNAVPHPQYIAQSVVDYSQVDVGDVYTMPEYGLVEVVLTNGRKSLNTID